MEITYRFANDAELAWMDARAQAVSETVEFRSMVAAPDPETGELDRALTQVKGVDGAYPLYGAVELSGGVTLDAALAERDGIWGLVMAPALVDRLDLSVGDRVRIGNAEYELRARLEREPDEAGGGFGLGPRTLMRVEALEGSGLLAPGTLYETEYRLRLAQDAPLDELRAGLAQSFPEAGLRWQDRRNGAPGVQAFVDRMGAFLVLVGLAALAMGGVGVSAAVRSYMERKTDTIATLKTVGAQGRTIFAAYLIQIGLLAALGVAIGLALGAAVPALLGPLLRDRLPVPALFDIYAQPLWEAGIYGVLTALIFALWPLARARDVRAAALYREAAEGARTLPRAQYLVAIGALTALLVGAAAAFSGIWPLALGFAGGVIGALGVLFLAALSVRALARRGARSRAVRGRSALRLALGSVGGPGSEAAGVVLSLGLGLAVLAAVGQVDWNLRNVLNNELPEKAPAYFFVDIQNDQIDGFLDRARGFDGVEEVETAPMLRGVITALNGVPAADLDVPEDYAWILEGDRGVTYSAAPPPGTKVVEGEWWPEDYRGETLVSFSAEHGRGAGAEAGRYADRLDPGPGDRGPGRQLPGGELPRHGDQFLHGDEPRRAGRGPAHPHRHGLCRARGGRAAAAGAGGRVSQRHRRAGAGRDRAGVGGAGGAGDGDPLGRLGDAGDGHRGADRRRGGRRAAARLRGGGAQDRGRRAGAHPGELRAPLGDSRGRGGRGRGDRGRRRGLGGDDLRDGLGLCVRAGLRDADRGRRRAGEPAGRACRSPFARWARVRLRSCARASDPSDR